MIHFYLIKQVRFIISKLFIRDKMRKLKVPKINDFKVFRLYRSFEIFLTVNQIYVSYRKPGIPGEKLSGYPIMNCVS